jgi:hypothetical protein
VRATGVDAAKVAPARVHLLDVETAGNSAEFFRAPGDAPRVKIVHALAQEHLRVHELAALLPVGASAVQHQFR